MRIRRSALAPLAAALAFAAGCSRGGDQADFTPPPTEVAIVEVAPRDVALPYESTARVEGSREVEVRARVSGILLRRAYDEGRPVAKGQLLFEIDPAPYRAEVQTARALVAEAEARRRRAEREVSRLQPLLAERAVSQKAYDDAVSESEQARASELAAQARLERAEVDLAYTRVTAPIAGLSSRALHSEGSLVEPGDDSLLTRLSQVEPIWIRFSVPDKSLLELRRGIAEGRIVSAAPGELEVAVVLADGSLHPERGKVNFADSRIDAATGAVDLRAEVPNAGGALVPGQFVRIRLLDVTLPGAIAVPQRAVQQGQQGKFVYVVAAGDLVELRPVEVGGWVGDDWIVESGLAAGDRVVVDGTSKVRPGAQVTVGAAPAAAPES